jgi:hypothetical protein
MATMMSFARRLGVLALIGLLAGCGGGSTSVSISPIDVTLSTGSAVTLQTGATLNITATITNDTTEAGLAWTLLPVTGCGFYQANSDTAVTYVAPTTAPPAPCTATIRATAKADASKTASVAITVQ